MLQVSDILFKFGETPLFDRLTFTVYTGHRVGLVGRNGVGKSTVFSLIRRELQPEEGTIEFPQKWQLAWLNQHTPPSSRSALDFVIDGDRQLRKIQIQINSAEQKGDSVELARLLGSYEDLDGYRKEAQAGRILHGLGFKKEDFQKPHREFSGGWRIRLNLAQTLMTPSDLMLLDEPTNHLDLEATVWLQKWLRKYQGTLICVSHDREFLDQSIEEIIHLEHNQAFQYQGNYSSFESQRAERLEHQGAIFERQELERQRIERFINRFRAKPTKAKQVQSRIKMLERMQLAPPLRSASPYRIKINSPGRYDNPMIRLDEVSLGYSGVSVLSDVTLRVYPRNRIGILGLNGAGKTTLLKGMSGELSASRGHVAVSERTKIGYFAQHQLELLNSELSPIAHLLEMETITEQSARNFLGGWGFQGDDIFRPVSQFSGGEKARLVLALITRTKPSILLLDEPTNHLDIEMRDELTLALQEYDGAMLIVAHDRHMLRNSVDEFWLVRHGTVLPFAGDLDDYEALVEEAESPMATRGKRESRREQRRERARERHAVQAQTKRQQEIEKLLELHQRELDGITEMLSDPNSFDNMESKEIQRQIRSHANLKEKIKKLEVEWDNLIEQMSEMS